MLKLFTKYLTIGVFNTAIHWMVFWVGVYVFMPVDLNISTGTTEFMTLMLGVNV